MIGNIIIDLLDCFGTMEDGGLKAVCGRKLIGVGEIMGRK